MQKPVSGSVLIHDLSRGIGRYLATHSLIVEALHTRVLHLGHQVSPKAQLDMPLRLSHECTRQASRSP
jgi:hypothetical protein